MHPETDRPATARTLTVVLDAWRSVLDRPVRPDDDFFAIGGDSLQAIDVADRIRERIAVALEYTDVFDHPTPAGLAERVETLRSEGA